jgi:hypothetical protein
MSDADIGVVNFNYNPDRHLVDQHGFIIDVDPELQGTAVTRRRDGGNAHGTPKTVYYIALPTDMWMNSVSVSLNPGDPASDYSSSAATIAHEMLHGSNVYHHGEENEEAEVLRWSDPQTTGNAVSVIENGNSSRVMVMIEPQLNGTQRAPDITPGSKWQMGRFNGLNSGSQDCVMRYNDADVYDFIHYGDGNNRVAVSPPQAKVASKWILCESSAGTGINNSSRARAFGDATCGKCSTQFCINDRFDHPAGCKQ